MNTRESYSTDVSDAAWRVLEPVVPAVKSGGPKGGRPATHTRREILNGIRYVLRSGGAWRLLPHDFPAWQTVYDYFRQWRKDGTWYRMNTALRRQLRLALGRNPEPSAAVLDSQSVKTAEKGGPGAMTLARR